MNAIHNLLVLLLLGYSVYSVVVYLARRANSRSARIAHQSAAGTPLRHLTAQECAALEPALTLLTPKAGRLVDDRVYRLEGRCSAHGITANGATTWHHTIGDVEVAFPFDAKQFIDEHCVAEVVYHGKHAVVVRTASGFDLLEGAARAKANEAQMAQWTAGRLGPMRPMGEAPESVADAIEILGQRDETPHEVAHRNSPGLGLVAALLLALGLAGIAIASDVDADTRLYWLVPALLLVAGGLFYAWRGAKAAKPGRVNRVRGPLTVRMLPRDDGTPVPGPVMLGDLISLEIPEHWRASMQIPEHPPEMEVRVSDNALLRFERQLSIDDETRRAPPVFWGRHLTLALLGACATALLLMLMPVTRDWRVTQATLRQGGKPLAYTSAEALLASTPEVGTAVSLSGQAICQGQGRDTSCNRLRWGGQRQPVELPPADALADTLLSQTLLVSRVDARTQMLQNLMLMQQGALRGDGSLAETLRQARLGTQQTQLLTGLPAAIKAVHASCSPADLKWEPLDDACKRFQQTLVERIEGLGEKSLDWAGWVKLVTSDELKDDDSIAMPASLVDALRKSAQTVGLARLSRAQAALGDRIDASQSGGVLLALEDTQHATLPTIVGPQSSRESYAELVRVATSGPGAFSVQGIVAERERDSTGTPLLVLDTQASLADPQRSMWRVGALVLSAALLLVHGALFLFMWAAARRRIARLSTAS